MDLDWTFIAEVAIGVAIGVIAAIVVVGFFWHLENR